MGRLSSKLAKSGASPMAPRDAYRIGVAAHNFTTTGRQQAPCLSLSKLHTNSAIRLGRFAAQRLLPRASAGVSKGTSQISRAYSPMARSDENHAIWAMFCMHIRVQSDDDSQSLSMRRWVAT